MKINVIKLEVEATAAEAVEALPSILHGAPTGTGTVLAEQPASTRLLEAPIASAGDNDRVSPAEAIVLPTERTNDDAWTPSPGPYSPTPTKRFERWEDIPVDRRVWGSGCHTCHVLRDPQDPFSTYCGHDVGEAFAGRRVPTGAKPCGNCQRRIEEDGRA